MGKKKNIKSFTVGGEDAARHVGLGFSPYQRDKGMAYTKSLSEKKRDERRQTKRNLKRGVWD